MPTVVTTISRQAVSVVDDEAEVDREVAGRDPVEPRTT